MIESLGRIGGMLMPGSTFVVKIGFLLSRNLVIRLTALNIFAGLLCPILKIVKQVNQEIKTWLEEEYCTHKIFSHVID